MKNRFIILFFIINLAVCFTGCSNNSTKVKNLSELIEIDSNISANIIKFDDNDYYVGISENSTKINLQGDTASVDGSGVIVSGSTIKINSSGSYVISGTLSDGSILVDVGEDENVNIILNNANIKCLTGSPIYVNRANKVIISLAGGSSNTISDTSNYNSDTEATAAIYSKNNLTINGLGELTIDADYNNAIQSKDILNIVGGTININSVNDGIIGKNMIQILNGNINITSGGDGIKATNDTDSVLGYVAVRGGNINVVADADGIQAETSLIIDGGKFSITAGGGSDAESSSSNYNFEKQDSKDTEDIDSLKGLKAKGSILITSGEFNINSLDDSIHSNNSIIIKNGDFEISSGNDGIHADTAISVEDGRINISKSYEGIESSSIMISGGEIDIISLDDGINIVGGKDGSSINVRESLTNDIYSD